MNTKELIYKKAHAEVYEVIKRLSKQDLEKIPINFIDNLKKNIDNDYICKYDDTKSLEEQSFLVETKALLIEIYERYLCQEEKKVFWDKYNKICINMIEKKKREEYNSKNIFKNKEVIKQESKKAELPVEWKKKNFFIKTITFLKKYLNFKKRKDINM